MSAWLGKIRNEDKKDSTAPYSSLSKVEACDPQTDTWESKAPMVSATWGLLLPGSSIDLET